MPPNIPWTVKTSHHPGSSSQEIRDEPDWKSAHAHEHRVGFRNRDGRVPGLTHEDDEARDEEAFDEAARRKHAMLKRRAEKGELITFRDVVRNEVDRALAYPHKRSEGWRFVLPETEGWVKKGQEWPVNVERREKEEEEREKKRSEEESGAEGKDHGADGEAGEKNGKVSSEEHDWKRKEEGANKHHDAYATGDADRNEKESNEKDSNRKDGDEKDSPNKSDPYTPQERALLKALKHELTYRKSLAENTGKLKPPQIKNRPSIAILEADQFTPDNWIPRSSTLVRLTGKHPLNAESELSALFNGGLITPNHLHYVRNHGAVPRILWHDHRLDVENGKLVLSMDELIQRFEAISIPVSLACDGNRRKELNLIRKSKGFNWGAGATGCVYWTGVLLRDVLIAAGVEEPQPGVRRWVNFRGADEPSEGRYETCIPLAYAMDVTNDVMLCYMMNGEYLPPDHGYPLRCLIPGYVGGRCVKWLSDVWTSDEENTSYYHIWDNRVIPSFITEKDGEFAKTMYHHPSTACNEQNLNSVIVKPAQGEKLPLISGKQTYRIEGYAYDGGGKEVERVEVSLDGGETWLYCIREFPDRPIRHGNKFWTWLHWHVDVTTVHLLQAKDISVRAWNVFKNTQPEKPIWNQMGMMNNCWYVVKSKIVEGDDDKTGPSVMFRHPVEPGSGDGGWQQPSAEMKMAAIKQSSGTPHKQFTRQEIEKHASEDDCWMVVDGSVYDVTSVLGWHPGGKSAILNHGGKVHQETTDEFSSVHDGFAYQKLSECAIGVVTDKARNFIKVNAEMAAKEKAEASKNADSDVLLKPHKWIPVKLTTRDELSEDTRSYTFALPDGVTDLGLTTCQHVQIGFHMSDKMLIRSYTPTKPIIPSPKAPPKGLNPSSSISSDIREGQGTFELVVKTYFPSSSQPGGAMSNILDTIPLGEHVDIRGPTGEILYQGHLRFTINGEEHTFTKVNLVLGGSGITPGYALLARAVLGVDEDMMQVRVVDGNKSQKDILLKDELDDLEGKSKGNLKVTHVLSHPEEGWEGLKGHVNEDVLKGSLFGPGEDTVTFLCGPPGMIQKAALPALKDWGFVEDENVFGF